MKKRMLAKLLAVVKVIGFVPAFEISASAAEVAPTGGCPGTYRGNTC